MSTGHTAGGGRLAAAWQWLTGDQAPAPLDAASDERVDWARALPFVAIHLACLGALWTGVSWTAVGVCAALYVARMFFITAFYHRYFSHRAFRTSRAFQLVIAVLACTAGQRGPLWWASHHRHHHGVADAHDDAHSPDHRGMLWAHMGWFLTRGNYATRWRFVRDWARYPELRWLNRLDWAPFVLLGAGVYALGALLAARAPGLGTDGAQLLVWGFFISTVCVYHGTYTINSLAHRFGRRRFATRDSSRNNFWLSLVTLGEGWHNNHHHYPATVRQGFYWWELDPTWYGLVVLSWSGLIRDLRPVPRAALASRRIDAAG
ncbi:MAG: acyl-CoA desaturase [Halofilum sp. (in: g-proteobacteria)]|nr:acyl-CoA desaturase [Halofilum sp. (in: g-proteobacteria)]